MKNEYAHLPEMQEYLRNDEEILRLTDVNRELCKILEGIICKYSVGDIVEVGDGRTARVKARSLLSPFVDGVFPRYLIQYIVPVQLARAATNYAGVVAEDIICRLIKSEGEKHEKEAS